MGKVYATQDMTHSMNLYHANQYGEFVFLSMRDYPILGVGGEPAEQYIRRLQRALDEFNPATDYILPIGDPVNIALSFSYLGRRHDFVSILKWDKQSKQYIPGTIPLKDMEGR